ncbi:MAG TPA: hypothetical protein VIK76_00890 [Pyrinomonadaceae bacterium]|jgi:hypothetical protein
MTNLRQCYIQGCSDDAIMSVRHRLFGLVATCNGHNPIRHAYDLPLVSAFESLIANRGPKTDTPGGGSKVLASPFAPIIPPIDGEALAVPKIDDVVKGFDATIKRLSMVEIVAKGREEKPVRAQVARTIAPMRREASPVDDDIV